jgi:hypothetical protein
MYLIKHNVCHSYLYDLLKDGYIRPSSQTNKTYLCGGEASDYIYLSLYSKKVIHPEFGYPIYLSSKILDDHKAYYMPYWTAISGPVKINKDCKLIEKKDLPKIEKHILNNIKKRFKKSGDSSELMHKIHSHQILIKKKIKLKKYIVCMPKIEKYFKKSSKTYVTKLTKLINNKYSKYIHNTC